VSKWQLMAPLSSPRFKSNSGSSGSREKARLDVLVIEHAERIPAENKARRPVPRVGLRDGSPVVVELAVDLRSVYRALESYSRQGCVRIFVAPRDVNTLATMGQRAGMAIGRPMRIFERAEVVRLRGTRSVDREDCPPDVSWSRDSSSGSPGSPPRVLPKGA
jgi:hypothetical protein